jgi:DNA invertase Pin-like site-specific DNA recombinase
MARAGRPPSGGGGPRGNAADHHSPGGAGQSMTGAPCIGCGQECCPQGSGGRLRPCPDNPLAVSCGHISAGGRICFFSPRNTSLLQTAQHGRQSDRLGFNPFRNPPHIGHRRSHRLCGLSLDRFQCSEYNKFMNSATALYVRVSTNGQRTDSQKKELLSYCRGRRWKRIAVYEDRMSGGSTSRPKLERLMKDMRAGKIERLLCFKLDRLGRSLTHLALILDEMNKLKIPLICIGQGIDTSTDSPAGRLQLNVLMAVAEFERGIIKERVNAGLKAAKSNGVQLGRPPTLQKRAVEVLALKKRGLGLRAISRKLGMPPSSVHSVLHAKPNSRRSPDKAS